MPRSSPLVLALLLASAALAQSPSAPSPAPAPEPPIPQTNTQPTSKSPTIQARTNLVVVDVVVTDRSGKNVHGLQPSDFALKEKGTPQQIRSFEEHIAPTQPLHPEPPPVLPPGVFTNYTPIPQTAALNVLLFDTLNTPLKDQAFVRQQLLQYIRTAPPGNRIAIFGLTSRLIYLQGFTSSPDLLRAAIDRKSLKSSPLLDDPANGTHVDQLSDTVAGLEASSHGAIGAVAANLAQFEAETQTFQLQLRTRYTLDGMNTLARYLSGFPGRKNLIWFSGSFPISVLPNGDLTDPFAAVSDMSEEFRETTNILTHSQVAVYPVDARGLFNAPMYDASERGNPNPQAFARQMSQFNQQTAAEHATMRSMAEQTGGRAFLNTNGLKQAVETAITTGANFYTLTYAPANTTFDGKYRSINLNLQGPAADQKLTLAYRRGYYAIDPNPPPPRQRRALTAGGDVLPVPPSPAAMRSAMMRGAPDPTQVIFKARVLPALPSSSPPDPQPDPNTRVNPDPKLAHGPWRHYTVDITAIPSQILSRDPATGNFTGVAEFVLHGYNSEGDLISATSSSVRLNLNAENVGRILSSGIPLHQVISLPAKGDYFLRIGVHDLVGDRVGALEISVSAIKNLPPLPSPAPPQPPAPPANP